MLLVFVASCHKSGGGMFHPYGTRHAKLIYEYSGNIRGYEADIFDSFGVVATHIIHSDIVQEKDVRTIRIQSFRHGAIETAADSERFVSSSAKNPWFDSLYRLPAGDAPSPSAAFSALFERQGFHKAGDTTIIGLPTSIWQFHEQRVYLYEWEGLIIGRQIFTGDQPLILRLVSIDTVSAIDPAVFVPPVGWPEPPPRQEQPPPQQQPQSQQFGPRQGPQQQGSQQQGSQQQAPQQQAPSGQP